MTKNILITGISGFAGSHLARYLISTQNHMLYGTYLIDESLMHVASIKDKIHLQKIDLTDSGKVYNLIHAIQPDLIFHLAAMPSPADSFKDPVKTINNNISAQINILEAVQKIGLQKTRILVVSSADVYGQVSKDDLPIDEETPFMPNNTYAVSKIAQDYLGLQYFLSYGLSIIRVRPFNHIGPGQSPAFVVSAFAQKIAEIQKGIKEPILYVGNIETKRDFTDVRDMVVAYSLIVEKGIPGDVYNIGSGISYKIADILDRLLSLSKRKILVKKDPLLFRPSDTQELVCDNRKFKKITGWNPKISIEITLKDTLDYWRNFVYNKS